MELDVRHSQSFFSRVLQAVLRPFKPRLVTPKKIAPAGSNKLQAIKALPHGVTIHERHLSSFYVYDVEHKLHSPQSNASKDHRKLRLYYFAGGGWQSPPTGSHWKMVVRFAEKVTGLTVTMVSMPLAPNSLAATTFPQLRDFFAAALIEAERRDEKVMLGGDSSGGNIALALALDVLKDAKQPITSFAGVLAISPAVDLKEMKEEGAVKEIAKRDPLLTLSSHNGEAELWSRGSDRAAAWISPVAADASLLATHGVKLIGITAGHDILTPDAIKFREACQAAGVQGAWLHWERQMHVFPLTFAYHLPEAKVAMQWIMQQLSKI